MKEPNYVLFTNDSVLMPEDQSKGFLWIKRAVWLFVGAIILGSLVFQDNLFAEMPLATQIVIISMVIGVLAKGFKTTYCPSDMELRFYDDYFVMFLPKRYYSTWVTRKIIRKMEYSKITRCVYEVRSNRICFYGSGNSTWYNYKRNGELPEKPTKSNDYTDGMIYFHTHCAPDVDFVKEIEEHSPIKVIVENN